MSLQFIRDNQGNTTGVFIPIEDWQGLKAKYTELQIQEVRANEALAAWQMRIVDARLDAYYNNPSEVEDFANVLDQIEKER
jgi:hypothetical protein